MDTERHSVFILVAEEQKNLNHSIQVLGDTYDPVIHPNTCRRATRRTGVLAWAIVERVI